MQRFRFVAVDAAGGLKSRVMTAASEADVIARIEKLGLKVRKVTAIDENPNVISSVIPTHLNTHQRPFILPKDEPKSDRMGGAFGNLHAIAETIGGGLAYILFGKVAWTDSWFAIWLRLLLGGLFIGQVIGVMIALIVADKNGLNIIVIVNSISISSLLAVLIVIVLEFVRYCLSGGRRPKSTREP